MKQRHKSIAAVYLVLRDDDKVLLLKRCNTGYCDNQFGLPSGHVEKGESIIDAMIREAKEEIDVEIEHGDLSLVHIRDRNAEDGHRIDFFFECSNWSGDIKNIEPHKCSELSWVEDYNLDDIIPYVKEVLDHIPQKTILSFEDW